MSQYHAQYGDYGPASHRPHRPPPQVDEHGYHFLAPHSSSSIYDDPDELEAMNELDGYLKDSETQVAHQGGEAADYAYESAPLSSPTPSSSGLLSSSNRLNASVYASNASHYSRAPPYVSASPPPQPSFSRSQFETYPASSSASRSRSQRPLSPPPALSHPTTLAGIVRPKPIRPMPMPNLARPVAKAPTQQFRPFARPRTPPSSASSLPPSRAQGAVNHRESLSMQPVKRTREQAIKDGGGRGSSNRLVEIHDGDEAEYDVDDEYKQAMMSIDTDCQGARQGRRSQVTTGIPQEPPVQYYDDLVPQGARTSRSAPEIGSAVNRVRKGGIKLVSVSNLPDAFRSIWRFGVFNAVQSYCFDSVYSSDENIVVSAPTGAGKTVLFELAIIRVFMSSTSDQSKVLYMAPTKSLCSERATDWKKKFGSGLGWKVVELTGDSEIGSTIWREVASSRIIVTTPEKWDAMTRRWHDHDKILSELQLFCVDEVHSVGTDVRGAVLEVVVSRMKTLGTSTRFVAVSATVPNIRDVADWLSNAGDRIPARVFEFGDEFRPCPLQKVVYGYNKSSNDFAFTKTLNLELFKLVKKHSSGNPVLIFCSTRKGCLEAAEQLVKDYKESLTTSQQTRQPLAWPRPPRSSYSINDKRVATLIENGVSIHHAGMDQNDRKLVEKLFLDGKISIICSTSTLAVGVNLPARMVIIRGTKGYSDGRMNDYADMDVLQMLGRAGRPQFDRLGVAVIMTERESQNRYENLVNAHKNLESCLHKNLTEHINSEITLRTITDVDSALRWLRSTFLYVRISKNSPYYAIATGTKMSPDARLEEICVEAVRQLVNEGIVVENEDQSLAPNEYGDIMSRFYISHPTFVVLKSAPSGANMRSLLERLSKSEELSSFRIRQGEKSILTKVNKTIRFPVEKVATTADRVMILIQVVLEGIPGQEIKTESANPLLDITAIWSPAIRIAKAMFDLAVLRKDGSARVAMELLRSLNGRCWDGSSFVLRQLKGIGEKSYKALVDAGIRSFADVATAAPDRLELILNRKPPYGSTLVGQAKTFPKFEVDLDLEHEDVRDDGVEVEVRVAVRLEKTNPPSITKKGPMNLYASLLILTSDNHFIEFRRCPLAAIAQGSVKPFSVSVALVKPSQRIVVSISCDLLAGSEVRAEVKPATKASDFPIPSLASEPDGSLDEFRATSTSRGPSMPLSAAVAKTGPRKRSIAAQSDTEDQTQATERKMRSDGKYECNHSCGDKSKCKHLCCREGLDKPPRKPATSKKRKVTTSRSNSLDQPDSTSASTAKTQSRIPMKVSSGVTLTQDASGKVVTRTKSSHDKFSSNAKSSTTKTNPTTEDDEDDTFDLPTPSQLAAGSYDKEAFKTTKKKMKGTKKKVVFTEPSPPPLPSRSRTASPDYPDPRGSSRSPSPPLAPPTFVKKQSAFKRSDLAIKKTSKVCLDEFASSDEDDLNDDLVVEGSKKKGSKKQSADEDAEVTAEVPEARGIVEKEIERAVQNADDDDDSLFRPDPFAFEYDPVFGDFAQEGGVGGIAEVESRVGAVDVGEEEFDEDTALALARSFEDTRGVEDGEGEDIKMKDVEEVGERVMRLGNERVLGQVEEEGDRDEEDDEFDDWLAGNVIIKD